jgi:hypothetical protein
MWKWCLWALKKSNFIGYISAVTLRRSIDGKRRTAGKYQIYHYGVKQAGAGLSGTIAETLGSGAKPGSLQHTGVKGNDALCSTTLMDTRY